MCVGSVVYHIFGGPAMTVVELTSTAAFTSWFELVGPGQYAGPFYKWFPKSVLRVLR